MTPGVSLNQSMDERIKEFRNDPDKMNVTTKFVNELVEKAKDEASKRMRERQEEENEKRREGERERVQEFKFEAGSGRKRGRWRFRARGFFSRLFGSLCFCSPEAQV